MRIAIPQLQLGARQSSWRYPLRVGDRAQPLLVCVDPPPRILEVSSAHQELRLPDLERDFGSTVVAPESGTIEVSCGAISTSS